LAANRVDIDPDELVLKIKPASAAVEQMLDRFDPFIDALCVGRLYQAEAIRAALTYLLGDYRDLGELASDNYAANPWLKKLHKTEADYLATIRLPDKLYATIDLATGTGKSYVLYGIAQLMLLTGLVDRVLVLCPSITIKDGLLTKFDELQRRGDLVAALPTSRGAAGVQDATGTIADYSICVANIHQTYKRTGSSVRPSLEGGQGSRVLILNDEVHHVAATQNDAKEWREFLTDPALAFRYILGATGTPYSGPTAETADNYFGDVIYRYSLAAATRDGIVKRVEYVDDNRSDPKAHWSLVYDNHHDKQKAYVARGLKPLTIIVTDKIATCDVIEAELIAFLAAQLGIPQVQAADKVLVVTSSSKHKANLPKLLTIDQPGNPCEWIVSVSMLTEGWDVKNVFQIVPHNARAFKSKLLIAQVLGRGLRLPAGLTTEQAVLTVFNHINFASYLSNLGVVSVQEQEEAARKVAAVRGEKPKVTAHVVDATNAIRGQYHFQLHRLAKSAVVGSSATTSSASTTLPAIALNYASQHDRQQTSVHYTGLAGAVIDRLQDPTITLTATEYHDVADTAAAMAVAIQKDKNTTAEVKNSAKQVYTVAALTKLVDAALLAAGETSGRMSEENYNRSLKALNVLRGSISPQLVYQPGLWQVAEVSTTSLGDSNTSLDEFLANDTLFHDEHSPDLTEDRTKNPNNHQNMVALFEDFGKPGGPGQVEVPTSRLRTPLNVAVSSYEPERKMIRSLTGGKAPTCLQAWIKSTDVGFYAIDFSMMKGGLRKDSHFNPDFFLKLNIAGWTVILVIETKADKDAKEENRAKRNAARAYFERLNQLLADAEASDSTPRPYYIFTFLSPTDYNTFFALLENCNLEQLKSYRSSLETDLMDTSPGDEETG